MTENKRIGIIVMVVSVVLTIMIMLASDSVCPANWPLFGWIMDCANLQFKSSDDLYYIVDIPSKYPIMICVVLFACGFLSYLGVLNQNQKS